MFKAFLRLMRPGEWVKNVFVLPALAFSLPALVAEHRDTAELLTELQPRLGATFAALVAFCFIASGFYAINDVLDVKSDRLHPIKRNRPVASGEISRPVAAMFGLVHIVAAFVLATSINLNLVLVLIAYAVLQALYNLLLKRVMLVDVVVVAIGFALRATAGAAAIEVQISIWLLLCVFFLCVYLGFVKRLCDLTSAGAAEAEADRAANRIDSSRWRSVAGYDDRAELNWLLGISAVLAMVTYLMYALSDHAWALFGSRSMGLALLSPLVLIAIHRFYRRASRGNSDTPLQALRDDHTVTVTVVLFVAGVLASLYAPPVQRMLDELFIARMPAAPLVEPMTK